MRSILPMLLVLVGASVWSAGCGDPPIGQPCNFSWPQTAGGGVDCADFPACHPLQETSGGLSLNDLACPIDCIQMPSLECENLICVATQIDGDFLHMNGKCAEDVAHTDCPGAPFGCSGYCTKECLTDAGCPKDYRCSAMAPFGTTLKCDNEADWGSSDPDKKCTATCTPGGQQAPTGVTCPESGLNADYSDCSLSEYSKCCTCICYQFCPILQKKFCRKQNWDENMFPDSTTKASSCGGGGD